MSNADEIFKSMCIDIINTGTDTKNQLVRPIWPDTGEKAYTVKKFGICNKYDLRKEFPAITMRPTALKSSMDEILWIWQKKSNNVNDLNSNIWNSWADKYGSIGKAYGFQIGSRYVHHIVSYDDNNKYDIHEKLINEKEKYPSFWIHDNKAKSCFEILLDQTDGILWDLRNNPFSRRIMANMYNFIDLKDMNLYPCAYSTTFNVTIDKNTNNLILNCLLNQRSSDIAVAGNWNVVQYSILLMMIAQSCNMIPGELIHMISDAHIYDRHIPLIKEMLSRETYPAPTVSLNPKVKDFYKFTTNDLIVENYISGPQIHFPVAV